jgi:hypothetical protein
MICLVAWRSVYQYSTSTSTSTVGIAKTTDLPVLCSSLYCILHTAARKNVRYQLRFAFPAEIKDVRTASNFINFLKKGLTSLRTSTNEFQKREQKYSITILP